MRVVLSPDRPRVEVALSNGSLALLSPLEFQDRHWLEEGLGELSEHSRYSRFGMGIAGLSDAELDYLADVDQTSHVAWGASIDGFGAGVGRYISVEGVACPEVAITVLDEYQGHGLGKCLLRALVAVARHDDVDALCFEIAPDNTLVRLMLSSFATDVRTVEGMTNGRIVIADVPPDEAEARYVTAILAVRS